MRKVPLVKGEYYHIFNRGVDKRNIFFSESDFQRFLKSMGEFNTAQPIGSIYENSFRKVDKSKNKPLVEFTAYCLNPNHFHFILKQVAEDGIQKFMQRMGGYTKYFNEKHKRSGVLFQGKFKSVHIELNEQLLYLSAYVNFNYLVHGLGSRTSKSSWEEYLNKKKTNLSDGRIILGQCRNLKEYEKMARETVNTIKEKRDMEKLLLE